MKEVDASEILDIAMAGTSATLLAKRWESALLVNVDNDTLRRLLANDEAISALMSIEGFRSLNDDIKTIINKSEAVKKVKKEKGDNLTPKEKKELTAEEKEFKSKRKEIQEKLIKFATLIPVFMYLTDYREETLYDVITQLEPGLFKKVTGLDVSDFNLLVSLGVFNSALMNDAVYKFRRYEDASLVYTGINKHEGEKVGLYDTSLSNYDYLYEKQQESMIGPTGKAIDSSVKVSSIKEKQITKNQQRTQELSTSAWQNSQGFQANIRSEQTAGISKVAKSDWINNYLEENNLEFIDKREKDGNLWVLGDEKIKQVINGLNENGASFKFKPEGGKLTKHQPGWWMKGYPEKLVKEEDKPLSLEIEIESIKPGDTLVHKAFGEGIVMKINDEYIYIDFNEGKKKPFRKFIFPSTFYQGILNCKSKR